MQFYLRPFLQTHLCSNDLVYYHPFLVAKATLKEALSILLSVGEAFLKKRKFK